MYWHFFLIFLINALIKLYPKSFLIFMQYAQLVVLCNDFYKTTISGVKTKKMSCVTKYCIKLSFVWVGIKNCMRWYSLLFSIIYGFVIPNSSSHCTCRRIYIMYSYICIMFYFCVCQNFVCHTKQVTSVPSHHQPAKGSSVVLPPSIIPRKSIVLPPLISPPAHADLPLHVSSQTVNQPREEALYLFHQSVHSHPLEVALCCHRQSYQEKASCCRCWSVCLCTLTRRRT